MKRIRVRFLALFLLFCSISLLTSCKKKEEEPKKEIQEEKKEEKSEEIAIEVPPVSIDGVLYAVVLEKGKDRLLVQSDWGQALRLPLSDTTDLTEIGEELTTGAAIRVEYSGNLITKKKKKLKVEKILPSDKLPKVSKEALELCANIMLAFERQSLEELSQLCEYPLFIDKGEKIRIGDEKAFLALKKEDVFDKELVRQVSLVNPFMLKEYPQGFILGKSVPNLIVSNTKKGWKLSAFHYK